MRLLLVTAVDAECDALLAGLPPAWPGTVAAIGVGPAAAAAGTARLLALAEATGEPYDAVLSAGIAGGFAGRAALGATALATASVAADLGADSPDGFLPLDVLGYGVTRLPADPRLLTWLRKALSGAVTGTVLTVSTVTGTAAGADALAKRYPDAVAEGMEGFGVASAAAGAGIAFGELRTIANPVGPRDRSGWRIAEALAELSAAARLLDTFDRLGTLDW